MKRFSYKKIKRYNKENPYEDEKGYTLLFLVFTSIISYFMVEIPNGDEWMYFEFPFSFLFIFVNILIFYIIMYGSYYLVGNLRISGILSATLFYVLGTVNYFVHQFRGNVLLPSDVFSIQTAVGVAERYRIGLSPRLLASFLLFALLVLSVLIYTNKVRIKKKRLAVRFTISILSCLLFFIVSKMDEQNFIGTYSGWDIGGFAFYFVQNINRMSIKRPEAYASVNIPETYQLDERYAKEGIKPDIVVIMNESFANLQEVMDFEASEEAMPFVNGLRNKPNAVSGSVYCPVYGGGTANTEFEFLTMASMSFFDSDLVPYARGFKKEGVPSLVTVLNDYGYETTAVHPYSEKSWNRRYVYDKMEFDHAFFYPHLMEEASIKEKMDQTEDFLIPDELNYSYIQKILDNKEAPQFIFNVTIQNHGPYDYRETSDVAILSPIQEEGIRKETNEYLGLIKQSDAAIEQFIHYCENREKPTIVLFFGDHQPGFAKSLATELNLTLEEHEFFKVPFFIWANYEIEEEHGITTSVNYLQNLLLEKSKMGPLTSGADYVEKVRKEFPVLSEYRVIGNGGKVFHYNEIKNNERIHKYACLVYRELYDLNP